jgi:hypothetical protein
LTIHLCQYLILGRVDEYNHVAKALQPMTSAIPLENIVVNLHQLHPPPSNLIFPPIFYYQPQHTFVMDKTMFAQALAIAPHFSFNGLYGMVYEHIFGCFIPKDSSLGFSKLFQIVIVITRGNIFSLAALVLGLVDCWQWQRTLVVFVLLP